MTQLEESRAGNITPVMEFVAKEEGYTEEYIRSLIESGEIVIPANKNHKGLKPVGIGKGLKTKVNANIGTSTDCCNPDYEIEKLESALSAGADAVMDLSTGGDVDSIRKRVIENCPKPIGTVPVYQIMVELEGEKEYKKVTEKILSTIKKHAEMGVDFITIHCGVTKQLVEKFEKAGRITGVVSRGGSYLARLIKLSGEENPFYRYYDEICDIAREYDVTFSLGDGLRPGCLHDASDELMYGEMYVLGELTQRAKEKGVQVMIEGPGHMPLDQIVPNVILEKKICHGAPYYVLGPLVTDVAPGYDHITSAIGGAIAASAGVDFLCYVTPSEHLCLPLIEDVHEGVIATRIAAHAGDIVKKVPGAREWDDQMSKYRGKLDWDGMEKTCMDPKLFSKRRASGPLDDPDVCSMCGKFCAMHQ